jgi:hypothetical protein
MVHIHVMGASGSGATSLGRALSEKLDIADLDTDDFFWLPTDPPFTTPRDADERIRLLLEHFLVRLKHSAGAGFRQGRGDWRWAYPLVRPSRSPLILAERCPALRVG